MFGQACLLPDDPELGGADPGAGDGVVGVVGVVAADAVEALVVPVLALVVVLGEAAPATAAAPPPVASAPATIVAPSSFEMCMVNLLGWIASLSIVRAFAKRRRRGV